MQKVKTMVEKKQNNEKMENEDEIIRVGKKPVSAYSPVVMSQLMNKKKSVITARGRSMLTAIDLAEMVRHRMVKDSRIEKIITNTEEIPLRDTDRMVKISTIEITMVR